MNAIAAKQLIWRN